MLLNGWIKILNILHIQVCTCRICIFPQTPQQVKATMIFVDEVVWRCKASIRSGIPGSHELLQDWDGQAGTVVAAARRSPGSGAALGWWGCLPECSPPVLGGLCAASLLQELLQDEASCYNLSRINSCQHQKEVLLQAVSFCPLLGDVCGVF